MNACDIPEVIEDTNENVDIGKFPVRSPRSAGRKCVKSMTFEQMEI